MTRAAGLHSIGSVPCPLAVARPLAVGRLLATGRQLAAARPLAGVRDTAAPAARYPALTKRRVIDYCRVATAL